MRLRLYISLLALALLASCSEGGDTNVVAVTVPAQRWVAARLLGDDATVVCLLGSGGDPETYEPTMEQMRRLAEASLLFTTGDSLGFEHAVVERARDNNPGLKVVNTGARITAAEHQHDHDHDHGSARDPHVWTSPRNVKAMAEAMARELAERDPAVTARSAALEATLDSLDHRLTLLLRPVRGTSFVVWHPAFTYFARDYGLRQIALDDGHELSGSRLKAMLDDIGRSGARVMIVQRGVDSAQARAVARELGLTVVEVDIMSDAWDTELIKIATVLSRENVKR